MVLICFDRVCLVVFDQTGSFWGMTFANLRPTVCSEA